MFLVSYLGIWFNTNLPVIIIRMYVDPRLSRVRVFSFEDEAKVFEPDR